MATCMGGEPVMDVWIAAGAAALIGYLLGATPWGVVLTKLAGAGDLRSMGSGNIGATNVLRTGRKGLAAATLLLDALKGTVAVLIARALHADVAMFGAVFAFLGHLYPVFLKFHGGKGVATLLGALLALHWPTALVYAAVWIGALLLIRISSVGGMLAAVSAPLAAALLGRFDVVMFALGAALLLLWKHGPNIERLLAGTEPRIGRKPADG